MANGRLEAKKVGSDGKDVNAHDDENDDVAPLDY